MNEASSEARKATAPAMSRGVPMRQRALASAMARLSSALKQESMSVSTEPGATAFTLIPEGPSSFESPFTKAMMPPLVAE